MRMFLLIFLKVGSGALLKTLHMLHLVVLLIKVHLFQMVYLTSKCII